MLNIPDNPWNVLLQNNLDISINSKTEKYIQLKEKLKLINLIPTCFVKELDLVICKNCNVITSKIQSVNHLKRHDEDRFSNIPYSIDDEKKFDKPKNINKNKTKNNLKKKGSFTKLNKVNQREANIDVEDLSFVPKSILNTDHPLKLKIQLQPKSKDIVPELICSKSSDNIFEAFNYQNTKTQNGDVRKSEVRSLNEFLKQYNDKSMVKEEEVESKQVIEDPATQLYQKVQSNEHVFKYRKTEPKSPEFIKSVEEDNMTLSRKIIPCVQNKNNFTNNSQSFQNQYINEQKPNQNKNVFQNGPNNVVRFGKQRKCVRIQHMNEASNEVSDGLITGESLINPTSLLLSSISSSSTPLVPISKMGYNSEIQIQSEQHSHPIHYSHQQHHINITSDPPPTSSIIYPQSDTTTQRQFQRRLIQNGIISESDITRCITNKSSISSCTSLSAVTSSSSSMYPPAPLSSISHVNTSAIANNNNTTNYLTNRSTHITNTISPNNRLVGSNKRKTARKSNVTTSLPIQCDNRPNYQNIMHIGSNQLKNQSRLFPNHTYVHTNNNKVVISKNKPMPVQLKYPVVKQTTLHQYQQRSFSNISQQQTTGLSHSQMNYLHGSNNNNNNIIIGDESTTELSEDEFLLDNHQIASSHQSSGNVPESSSNTISISNYMDKQPIENIHYLPDYNLSSSSSTTSTYAHITNNNNHIHKDSYYQNPHYKSSFNKSNSYHHHNNNNNNVHYNHLYRSTQIQQQQQQQQQQNYRHQHQQQQQQQQHLHQHQQVHYELYDDDSFVITNNDNETRIRLNNNGRINPYLNNSAFSQDSEVISHGSNNTDSIDSGIHILPSPGKKIIDLPWDTF